MAERRKGVEPVKVFVGAPAHGEDAEACVVLEHTLRSRASVPVQLEWMRQSRDPASPYYCGPGGWDVGAWATPWEGFRWLAPALCDWEGVALYFDCPTIVRGDAAELARAALDVSSGGRPFVLARHEAAAPRTGCLAFNCAAAHRWYPTHTARGLAREVGLHQRMTRLLVDRRSLAGPLPAGWGLYDQDFSRDPGAVTGSVCCANLYMQPHYRHAARRLAASGAAHWFDAVRLAHYSPGLVELFDREYDAARAAGYTPDAYVPGEPVG